MLKAIPEIAPVNSKGAKKDLDPDIVSEPVKCTAVGVVGESAVPPKSPVSLKIPLILLVASFTVTPPEELII